MALGACPAGRLTRPPYVSAFLGLAVSSAPGPPAARGKPGDPDRDRQDGGDGEQRSDDGEMDAEAFEQELHADEDQDRSQAVMQVDEAVPQPFEGEVKVPQPQDGEGDRRVRHEGVRGDREHRRHGVNREDQIRRLDDDQHGQKRCGIPLAVPFTKKWSPR